LLLTTQLQAVLAPDVEEPPAAYNVIIVPAEVPARAFKTSGVTETESGPASQGAVMVMRDEFA
jgi:hypothetical protein